MAICAMDNRRIVFLAAWGYEEVVVVTGVMLFICYILPTNSFTTQRTKYTLTPTSNSPQLTSPKIEYNPFLCVKRNVWRAKCRISMPYFNVSPPPTLQFVNMFSIQCFCRCRSRTTTNKVSKTQSEPNKNSKNTNPYNRMLLFTRCKIMHHGISLIDSPEGGKVESIDFVTWYICLANRNPTFFHICNYQQWLTSSVAKQLNLKTTRSNTLGAHWLNNGINECVKMYKSWIGCKTFRQIWFGQMYLSTDFLTLQQNIWNFM